MISIGFKVYRCGPRNGYDPLIYLFVVYDDLELIDGRAVTVPKKLQINMGRASGVPARRDSLVTRHGLHADVSRRCWPGEINAERAPRCSGISTP